MAAAARMTGLQAYHRAIKSVIEDAERELPEKEWIALQDMLRIGLGFQVVSVVADALLAKADKITVVNAGAETVLKDRFADAPVASRKAPSPTRR